MSEQAPMQDHPAARTGAAATPGTNRERSAQPLRLLGLVAVCVGVATLAAVAFVLSYSGIRAVAMDAGISPRHADDYPLLIDAMLVITLLAVLGLRGAGLPSRILAWLALLAVLAAAAGADVQYATRHILRYTAAATIAAVLPWALVFIAFVLLLALLRHGRLRRQASVARRRAALGTDAGPAAARWQVSPRPAPPLPVRTPQPWTSNSIVPGFSSRLVSDATAGAAAGAAAEGSAPTAADAPPTAADAPPTAADAPPTDPDAGNPDTDPDAGNPGLPATVDEGAGNPGLPATVDEGAGNLGLPATVDEGAGTGTGTGAGPDGAGTGTSSGEEPADPAPDPYPASAADEGADDGAADNMPVFHRMWSTPTPPDS